jgi:23S rRNA C2498 (ribose-2'-O)-methylase RlmM
MKEYLVIDAVTNPAYLSKALNKYAEEGWRVHSVLTEHQFPTVRFLLEREKVADVISLQQRREKIATRIQEDKLSKLPLSDLGIEVERDE